MSWGVSVGFRSRSFSILAIVLALSGLVPRLAQGQMSASISGYITDRSGAAVPSVPVTVKNKDTGVSRMTSSDGTGHYLVLSLPIGNYDVEVKAQNFQPMVRGGIQLVIGQDA